MKAIQYITLAMLTGAIITSCTKKLDEVYQNPNAPVRVKPSELLPPMQYQMAMNLEEDFMYLGATAQVFACRYTFNNVPAVTRDRTITRHEMMGWFPGIDNSAAIWRMHYFNLGANLNKMIEWAAEDGQWDYVAAGYAMQAWSWLTTTDYHGELILTEAFRTDQLAFKYDPQDKIYDHVRNLCRLALENFDKAGTASQDFTAADQWFYQGNLNKWRKFVYGVLARSYNHLSNKSAYKADSVIFYCDKAMQTPDEDATYKYVGGPINAQNNYWGRFRANHTTLRQSKYIVDLMKGTQGVGSTFEGVDDPRRWYMLCTGTGVDVNNMYGIEPTKGETFNLSATQRPVNFWGSTVVPGVDTARFIFRDNSEFPLMTSSEIQFMKAEAAYRKGDKPTALAAYRQGISQHFDMLLSKYNVNIRAGRTMTTATRDAFLALPQVVPSAANLTMSQIMQQKFIALWGYGVLEAWTDLRRFHYTDIDPATGKQVFYAFTPPQGTDLWPDNGGKYSYRVRPRHNSEYVWNIAELAVYGGDKIDYHCKEMWFSLP
ncbi:MAG TPA: SusD/RagB family nutrient-binding outer membrane lipoprotein [Ferruginibacter sp.]|nr:SusD/RagB family nutrient-binding outer membrane lipoprotein [Ferruginibacter sp.]